MNYSWVDAHHKIAQWLKDYESRQPELIKTLKEIGIEPFNDKDAADKTIELTEIDPFTFFSYLYKYGNEKRLALLQTLCKKLGISPVPSDDEGIPSADARKVWFFPYKSDRQPKDITSLWKLFHACLEDQLTDEIFQSVLQVKNTGKTKLTHGLFYVKPESYLPIDAQTREHIEKMGIKTDFDTYSEYQGILAAVRQKLTIPFYQFSHECYVANQSSAEDETQPASAKNETQYWTYAPGENAECWDEFYDQGIMAIGWDETGDLNQYKTREDIAKKLQAQPGSEGSRKNDTTACDDFKNVMQVGDIVFAKRGTTQFLGYGVVTSDYYFDKNRQHYKHCRKIDWKAKGVWPADHSIIIKTLTNITDYEDYVVKLKNLIISGGSAQPMPKSNGPKNIILYGPPGTGKTYASISRAVELATGTVPENHKVAKAEFDRLRSEGQIAFVTFHQNYAYEDFMVGIRPNTTTDQELRFSNAYGIFYNLSKRAQANFLSAGGESQLPFEEVFEDFIAPLENEGKEIEVKMASGSHSFWITERNDYRLAFRKQSGGTAHTLSLDTLQELYEGTREFGSGLKSYYSPLVLKLKKLGKKTGSKTQLNNYVLVIDEINRANISRVFGELITLLEDDKRLGAENELRIHLANGDEFAVPPNLYLLGTMNTADKSIALVDIALRRRFSFEGIYPQYDVLNKQASELLRSLNAAVFAEKRSADYLIGHAYFMKGENLADVLTTKVIPLLMEYFAGKTEKVQSVFSSTGWSVEYDLDTYAWKVTPK